MRRDRQRLADILEALDWITKAISGKTENEFIADETLCYAVAQKLTIIGEAVARLDPELTAGHESVPWNTSASGGPSFGKPLRTTQGFLRTQIQSIQAAEFSA